MRCLFVTAVLMVAWVGCAPKDTTAGSDEGNKSAATTADAAAATPSPAPAAPAPAPVDPAALAKEVVTNLSSGNVAGVTAKFDATMKGALSEAKLKEVWDDVVAQFGPYKGQAGTRVEKIQGFDVAFVSTEFERGKADVQVTLDSAGQISGLFIRPPLAG